LHEFIYGYLMILPGAQNNAGLNENHYGVVNLKQGKGELLT
jgi:hypothetical protein